MLYGGEGIVEVMQENLPLLILRRAAKADGVVFEGLPLHEQEVAAAVFEAAAEFVGDIARRVGEDGRCSAECGLEAGFLISDDVEG